MTSGLPFGHDRRSFLQALITAGAGLGLAGRSQSALAFPQPPRTIRARNPGAPSRLPPGSEKKVLVVGAGIAGLSAALELAEKGYSVVVRDAMDVAGGRLATRRMETAAGSFAVEHGLHMWFDNYHVFRDIRRRLGIDAAFRPYNTVDFIFRDYEPEALRSDPPIYPLNLLGLMHRSPNLTVIDAAGQFNAMLDVMLFDFDKIDHLDEMTFVEWAKKRGVDKKFYDIILEPAASVTLNDPEKVSAYEMVLYMHLYFLSQPKAMNRDVTATDHGTAIIDPWVARLRALGAKVELGRRVGGLLFEDGKAAGEIGGERYDAVVLSTDVPGSNAILRTSEARDAASQESLGALRQRVSKMRAAPHYKILRTWLDRAPNADRPAVIETPQHKPINLMAEFNKLERESRNWSDRTGGSVMEFHLYANESLRGLADDEVWPLIRDTVVEVLPELAGANLIASTVGSYDNFTSFEVGQGTSRPAAAFPREVGLSNVALAGDWVHTEYPAALMERAVCTGREAANDILFYDGVREVELVVAPSIGPGLI